MELIALMTFKGQEGLVRKGQVFEVKRERRAEELITHKLAAYYEEKGADIGELLKALNSHDKVTEFAEAHNIVIPSRDEAKLDERKAAIEAALENAK